MGKKKGQKLQKEEDFDEEDWCFECYEGGLLLVCDHKHCLKSYHADCARIDKSSLETNDPWFCRRHFCNHCTRSSKYQCVGCPNAICGHCFDKFNFARVRGSKGICHNCVKLALLGEEGVDVDSDGECVDFNDLETSEGLFFDYWKKVVKEKEGLTLEDLQSADVQIKKDDKYRSGYKLKDPDNEDEFKPVGNAEDDVDDGDDNVCDVEGPASKRVHKRKKCNDPRSRLDTKKPRNNIPKSKSEVVSWASNCLIDFLKMVGEDPSKILERYTIASIIYKYADENKLFCPVNSSKIICDEKLKCLFGRKMVFKNKVIELLELHFPEFLESSDEEEEEEEEEDTRLSPKHKEKKVNTLFQKQRNTTTLKKSEKKELPVRAPPRPPPRPPSCFAFIVTENIKLVFLKRSLVEELLKEPETFESKVIGSFVRVKIDPGDGSRRYHFQLLPVTGIKRMSEENHAEVLLQVSTLTNDISINLLSDDNFSDEECADLKKKVKDGLIRRPTIVELEEKARNLHEDITKHRIAKELRTLQHRIDRANEKGWRREFVECFERQELLRKPEEVSRLLRKVPHVIPDLADDEPIANDGILENEKEEQISPIILASSETSAPNGEENGTFSDKEATKPSVSAELIQEKNIFKNEMNLILHEEKEAAKQSDTAELVAEKNISQNQMNDTLQVPAEKKGEGIASSPKEDLNRSTELCFLEVLSQESRRADPQVENKFLYDCDLFK